MLAKIRDNPRKVHEAYSASREKAEEYCKESNRKYVVVNEKSEYQGYDVKTKETMRAVGVGADICRSLSATSKHDRKTVQYGGYRGSSMDTNEDFRVTMTFECR